MYDLIIVGAGPAGITAAVYAARQKLNTLVISKDIGGQAALTWDIENYIGYQFISGADLAKKFEEHLRQYDVELREGEEVVNIKKEDDVIKVKTDEGVYESKAVIIASGRKPRLLNVPGETEFKNRGVTYCAACDGPLFADKDVAVIGGGNSAMISTLQLMNIANKIYLITINPELRGEEVMKEKIKASKKVMLLNNTITLEILGNRMVTGLRVKREGKEQILKVQGVFIEIGSIPNSDFIKIVNKNEFDEILVNERNETNVPGIFAAGDVTDVPEKQIIVAAGEAAKAALTAFKYVSKMK